MQFKRSTTRAPAAHGTVGPIDRWSGHTAISAMDILILGGGVFLGRACLDAALSAGHRVTVFNRGKARDAWPRGVHVVLGDRKSDLHRLAGARWDAVIDTCGFLPQDVTASAEVLRERCGQYLFVSSVSVYASFRSGPVRESDPLAVLGDLPHDTVTNLNYGALKAACEHAVTRVFGSSATLVRPGLIAGGADRTGRFSYWPWRFAEGGRVLAPGRPERRIQFIDAVDLAKWMVALCEESRAGTFNATGPVEGGTWGELLSACAMVAARRSAPASNVAWVDEDWLLAQKVAPWSELPLWVPSTDPEMAAFDDIDIAPAIAAGLSTRPTAETAAEILGAATPPAEDPRRVGKLTREREAALLSSWQNCGSPSV